MSDTPAPTEIRLDRDAGLLHLTFADGAQFDLPAEYLRVYSPSAELTGHGNAPRRFPSGKRHVRIVDIQAVGHYAIRPVFDDGHETGLFRWAWLYELGATFESKWADYLTALDQSGGTRE